MTVDKSAANRFIKHAIAQAVGAQGQPSEPAVQGSTPGPSKVQEQPIPAGAVTKIIARAEWEKQVQEAEGEEEEDLEVFDEAEGPNLEIAEDKAPKSTPTRTGETTDFSEQRSGMSIPLLHFCLSPRLTFTTGHTATAKKVKKKHKKAKLPLTGSVFTADTNAGTGFTDVSSNLQVAPPQPEAHADPTPDATEANNGKKRPSELLTGDPEDPSHASALATASAPPKKKQKRNKKKGSQTTTATEIDGITTSRSQSHSRSRDVSVPSVPQVATQSLSGVETDLPTRDAADKPTRWKKRDRKNRNTNAQQATTETTGSQH